MTSSTRKITVGFLVFPGFQLLDVAGPMDAFAEVKEISKGKSRYDILIIGNRRSGLRSSSGLEVHPDLLISDELPHLDTLIIPGGLGVFDVMDDSALVAWLATQYDSCRRTAAICNGVFALASAGLINGRNVSTHWMDAANLSNQFPKAKVDADRIYTRDGSLYTTAGVTAGIDLALAFIEEDQGREMAVAVAKFLIVYLRRPGSQSQFSPLLEMQSSLDSDVARIQDYIMLNLTQPHSLSSLAQWAGTSERNLSRQFKKNTGVSVMEFVRSARMDAARRLLENTTLPITEVALVCGFQYAESMRRAFMERLELSPLDYRRRFRSTD